MTTEFSTIARQVFVKDNSSDPEITGAHIIKEAVDSGYKHLIAGLISLGVKQALTKSIIPHAQHDEVMAFMNVLIGYGIDEAYRISTALLAEIQSFSEKLT